MRPVITNFPKSSQLLKRGTVLVIALSFAILLKAQSVSEIITDYNGYYKTGSAAVNPVKPDNSHNLLSFSFNGVRYSTGVNDALLTSRGETFTAGSFRALPMTNITGTPNGNTKIGLGAMADGVYNGAGTPPSRNLGQYLNDGINGLNIGTAVANLPAGTMFLSVSNLQAAHIGDGIPDILVTQVADPSSSDRYAFTDVGGNVVGTSINVNLSSITPVGSWVADFYEATGSTGLKPGYVQSSKHIRLWAADFSAFGINASNIGNIAYFKIDLSGNSDVAFVAYNTTTITVQQVLAAPREIERRQTFTSISREKEITSLKVFPNPAFSEVSFVHPTSTGKEKILVYSLNGLLFMQHPVGINSTQTKLNITCLPRGSYHVVYINGTDKYSQKLLVQ
jgi:hypothetical protein